MGFSEKLIVWYNENKRDLPWRKTTDPYQIWLSEIILQQTRVDQGLDYYNKFIKKHPNVHSLAKSSEKDILNLWQGLGYYSRARNLHFTAKYISNELNGNFPTEHKDILNLKGVGEYTAAAIASFSYKEPYPVIDGNVYRVLSRIFGIENPIDSSAGKKIFKKLAAELIDIKNPDTYNQAIMEFGALQCTPKNPNCESCPYLLECFAQKNNIIGELPKKEKKIKQRNRYFNYLVIVDNENIYLNERKGKGIWQGLFDFPLLETKEQLNSFPKMDKEFNNLDLTLKNQSPEFKHILSHQKIYATFWLVSTNNPINIDSKYVKIPLKEINNYPVPKLIDNYLKTLP
ncbi:A/G-specific adenine glycosylase [Vicingaceae bacterium]|nr:A/G-specific adenine glycosylase [Vicingaceae bacterium]